MSEHQDNRPTAPRHNRSTPTPHESECQPKIDDAPTSFSDKRHCYGTLKVDYWVCDIHGLSGEGPFYCVQCVIESLPSREEIEWALDMRDIGLVAIDPAKYPWTACGYRLVDGRFKWFSEKWSGE